jgi:ribosomal protein S18 acetylase RimI-like enzyme
MLSLRGFAPPSYRRLLSSELDAIRQIEFDPSRADRFIGPIGDILTTVRRNPASSLIAIEASEGLIGFYVVHPDRRDGACWWLGWLAIDRRQEGGGYGRSALLAAMARLRGVEGCRRIRLLVAPENSRALHLYNRFGFHIVGRNVATDELVLEFDLPVPFQAADLAEFILAAVAAKARRVFRHRRLRSTVGPHAAWIIGVERGPPVPQKRRQAGRTSRPAYRQADQRALRRA